MKYLKNYIIYFMAALLAKNKRRKVKGGTAWRQPSTLWWKHEERATRNVERVPQTTNNTWTKLSRLADNDADDDANGESEKGWTFRRKNFAFAFFFILRSRCELKRYFRCPLCVCLHVCMWLA